MISICLIWSMAGVQISYFYDPELGSYYYGPGHPMKPHRIRMAHNLILHYGLHNQMEVRILLISIEFMRHPLPKYPSITSWLFITIRPRPDPCHGCCSLLRQLYPTNLIITANCKDLPCRSSDRACALRMTWRGFILMTMLTSWSALHPRTRSLLIMEQESAFNSDLPEESACDKQA